MRLAALLLVLAAPVLAQSPFEGLGEPISASPADWQAVGRAIDGRLRGWKLPALPKPFEKDAAPRVAFISASMGGPARVVHARGLGARDALERAAAQLENRPDGWKWLKVDLVQKARVPDGPAAFDPSMEGELTDSGFWLPEQLGARGMADASPRYVFLSSSVFMSDAGPLNLYRGHRVSRPITQAGAHEAVDGGARYLKDSIGADGRFTYIYDPVHDKVPDQYSLLRHAGSILPLFELQRSKPDPAAMAAAKRALSWLLAQAKPCPKGKGLCLVEKEAVSLGGNALGVLALARCLQLAPEPAFEEPMKKLALWLLDSQSSDGDFAHKVDYPSGRVRKFRSDYFSGQAILALIELYKVDRDAKWLDAAERAVGFLREARDRKVPVARLPHDHWLLQGLDELQRQRPKPEHPAYAMRLADSILGAQNQAPGDPPDWRWGWGRPPRSTPAATRAEGLCAAYRLARDFGEEARAAKIRSSLERALEFQIQTQIGPETAMYLKDPKRALGGFRRSLDVLELRTDYTQHNLASLLCWLANR
ncbi:MAG: hypothetical protein HY925_15105 [Elusimicrobia bacterium]|nr:hypothetical protein [Elusimicrobiota bacterium]